MAPMSDETPRIRDDRQPTLPRTRGRLRSAQDSRDRRRTLLTWGLAVALSVLLVNSLIGENGYLATVRASHEQAELVASLAKIRIENQQLQEESRRLRNDPAALEATARRALGFIRPGETLVIVHDASPSATEK
ncbi:MAG: septum formation initiator family protein [Acidobacteriota bacterium]